MRIEKYGFRHWAVYDAADELVCVTVYKNGAVEVVKRLSITNNDSPSKSCTDMADIMKVVKEIRSASSKLNKITKELLPQLQI